MEESLPQPITSTLEQLLRCTAHLYRKKNQDTIINHDDKIILLKFNNSRGAGSIRKYYCGVIA